MQVFTESSKHHVQPARRFAMPFRAIALLILTASGLLSVTDGHGPACLIKALTHISCPGCGLSRSLVCLWRGEFALSLRFHPLGFLVFIMCWFQLLKFIWYRGGRSIVPQQSKLASAKTSQYSALFAGALFFVFWLMRLISWSSGSRFFLQ